MGFMTYEQIGNDIGITKQAVSNNLKKAINKVYDQILIKVTKCNAFAALMQMVFLFNIDNHDDFIQMYKLLSKENKQIIEDSCEWRMYAPK